MQNTFREKDIMDVNQKNIFHLMKCIKIMVTMFMDNLKHQDGHKWTPQGKGKPSSCLKGWQPNLFLFSKPKTNQTLPSFLSYLSAKPPPLLSLGTFPVLNSKKQFTLCLFFSLPLH